ncbi:hypothetical protein MACH24_25050 [Erythrobacter sp. Dej080120_24]|uniref:GNAT family N-acetyltransferase n=1 Tax=Erythrobacter sp. Dej080120_24 TaxID=3024837 RepID=UPI002924F6BB|nr:hypothetical protein MACH24_25050 [Erythrobacter sp. Dej080120_24]
MSSTPHEIDRIMAVMEAAFDPAYGEAWNRRQVSDALALPSTHALVIDSDGQAIAADALPHAAEVAGFVLTRHAADEEELLLIGVIPEFRRRGLGEALIDRLFAQARARGVSRIFLEMRRGNPAIHLYEKVGFEPIGLRPNYYRLTNGGRVDAITFGCSI